MSLYQLTIEKGTPFFKMHKTGKIVLPEAEIAAEMYDWTNEYMKSCGLDQYEISNYAKSGRECKHNINYWKYGEYLGIGPGAHSRILRGSGLMAIMNYSSPAKWMQCITNNESTIQTNTPLTDQEIIEEILMMGLRLKSGVADMRLRSLLGVSFADVLNLSAVKDYVDMGFLEYEPHQIKLTRKGLIYHNYLVPRIIKS
jgi:oxygen-independent coproporphyrinogen-3 oxidase